MKSPPSKASVSPNDLHPMQAAFVTCDAYQCGYCTSGQIMSAVALLQGTLRAGRRGGEGINERQHLPLRRLPEHRRGDPERAAQERREKEVKAFHLTRASDSAYAMATAAKATTAQQGAEIRFIAGGTTLARSDEVECRAAQSSWWTSAGCRSIKLRKARKAA